MKIVALGANLPSRFGTPAQTLYAALKALAENHILPVQVSRIWKTAPVPFDPDQPWYHNAVAMVQTDKNPHELLRALLAIEDDFGRVRSIKNAPRLLDLDLIAYDEEIVQDGPELLIPHPRMTQRAFVLRPMSDITDEWVHPQTGETLEHLLKNIPADQEAEPLENGWDE